ncbi:MAG: hypothetical protein CL928_02080 [Deltaproteobacteria bacterium]|nr:hypothetical protein [Deltaproteobacteria bacterium]
MMSVCPARLRSGPCRRLAPGVLAILIWSLTACNDGPGVEDQIISGTLATTISNSAYMAAALGFDLALLADETPALGSCPGVTQDGNVLALEYGTGCVPTSGITSEQISGHAEITLASGMGAFTGTMDGLGFPNLPVWGSLNGTVSAAGEFVTVNVQLEDGVWGENNEYELDILFELEGDSDRYRLDASTGVMLPAEMPEAFLDLEGVEITPGGLGSCALPSAGRMRIERGFASADLNYTPESAATGSVHISYNADQAGTITPCP